MKMMKILKWALGAAVLFAGIAFATSAMRAGDQPANTDGKLKIVAAENFWGNIAEQIGGSQVSVTSIITDPGTDPHLYESNANNAAAIATADIVITNGLGYDDFFDKLLAASKNNRRQVLSAAAIMEVSGGSANPHLWYDVPRVHLVAAQIAATLTAKDPGHQAMYEQNLAQFKQSLQPVLDVISQIKSQYPAAPVAYTERVAGYLLDDAGLQVKSPAGFSAAIEDGNDPSPADTAAMNALISGRSVKLLLYNSQATSPVTQRVQALAEASGVPVVGVTETLPTTELSYQSWQLHQAQAILAALGAK